MKKCYYLIKKNAESSVWKIEYTFTTFIGI